MGLGARDRWSVLVALEILPDRTRSLVALLRLGGVVTCMAFAALLMPFEWMVSTHRALSDGSLLLVFIRALNPDERLQIDHVARFQIARVSTDSLGK